MPKFEIDEFEERLTDSCIQKLKLTQKGHYVLVYKFAIMDIKFWLFSKDVELNYQQVLVDLYTNMHVDMAIIWSVLCSSSICSDDFIKICQEWKRGRGVLR